VLRQAVPGFLAEQIFKLVGGMGDPAPALAKLLGFHPVITLFPDGGGFVDAALDLAQAEDQAGDHVPGFGVNGLLGAQVTQ